MLILTYGEGVIPPVGLAEEGLQIVGCAACKRKFALVINIIHKINLGASPLFEGPFGLRSLSTFQCSLSTHSRVQYNKGAFCRQKEEFLECILKISFLKMHFSPAES